MKIHVSRGQKVSDVNSDKSTGYPCKSLFAKRTHFIESIKVTRIPRSNEDFV